MTITSMPVLVQRTARCSVLTAHAAPASACARVLVRGTYRQPRSLLAAASMAQPSEKGENIVETLFGQARQRVKSQLLLEPGLTHAVPVQLVYGDAALAQLQDASILAWARACRFTAKSGEVLLLPGGDDGGVAGVLLGMADDVMHTPWPYAALPGRLPAGTYTLQLPTEEVAVADAALLGWMLGCYRFERYKSGSGVDSGEQRPLLVPPPSADMRCVLAMAEATFWARDLINTPAEDMGPQHLAAEAAAMASAHTGAAVSVIEGDALLSAGYPAVHTVGRAAGRPPLLMELRWQPPADDTAAAQGGGLSSAASDVRAPLQGDAASTSLPPLLALVGKGVCFDSGGLDIKTAAGMRLMKKDMGGAALMLALAHVIMTVALPVRLRVLVPAVENAIAGNAYRPGDVLHTRAKITVENGNTDAEGRLILCDALYEAATGDAGGPPDLLIDAATLTGAARVALGQELPAVFSSSDEAWQALEAAAAQQGDPMWRLPLWRGYRKQLDSKVADICSTGGEAGAAGAITAALFLWEFTRTAPAWLHIDTAGWVSGSTTGPGRPEGGEALGLRALWAFVRGRYVAGRQ